MSLQDPVVVVGAGISGLACAGVLAQAGLPVRVLDRGRRVGGRMSGRELGGRPVDLGASYLTAADPDFEAVVGGWERRGLARRWTDTFDVIADGSRGEPKQGPVRWGAQHGLQRLVADLAEGLEVTRHDVAGVERVDGRLRVDDAVASAVVLAMPDPQARRLLRRGLDDERGVLDREFEPVLALAAWWPERSWAAGRPFDGAFVNGDDDLAWIADDGARRGDGAAALVAHTTPAYAAEHLEDPAAAGPELEDDLRRLLGIDAPAAGHHVQRWTYARPVGEREAGHHLGEHLVGFCGDGWGMPPKVETAWLSGRSLGRDLVERLA